ncbi:MAG: acyltransferase [Butyrivibrio sp.]|nr:acyltransferase [Butyrivibrio sp.]
MERSKYAIKNTLGMFDLLKGVMMILMIMAHTYGLFDVLYTYINTEDSATAQNPVVLFLILLFMAFGEASMPVLFVISGYGFRKTTFKKTVDKQFKTLIIPYLITMCVTCVMHFVIYFLLFRPGGRETTVQTLKLFLSFLFGFSTETNYFGIHLGVCGPVWFLLALFIGNVIFNELLNRFEGIKLLIAASAVSLIGWLLSLGSPIPWAISQGLVAVLFLCLGYMAKKYKIFTSGKNPALRAIVVLTIVVSSFIMKAFAGEFNMALNAYSWGPVSIVVGGLFSCVSVYLFLYLNRFKGKISEFIRKIGRLSLYVLCIHAIEMMSMGVYVQYDLINNWQGNRRVACWLVFAARFAIVMVGTFGFVQVKDFIAKKKETNN